MESVSNTDSEYPEQMTFGDLLREEDNRAYRQHKERERLDRMSEWEVEETEPANNKAEL